jgi:hypothetical protein
LQVLSPIVSSQGHAGVLEILPIKAEREREKINILCVFITQFVEVTEDAEELRL